MELKIEPTTGCSWITNSKACWDRMPRIATRLNLSADWMVQLCYAWNGVI